MKVVEANMLVDIDPKDKDEGVVPERRKYFIFSEVTEEYVFLPSLRFSAILSWLLRNIIFIYAWNL